MFAPCYRPRDNARRLANTTLDTACRRLDQYRDAPAEPENSSVIHFSIDQWRAWAPGIESADDWARWSTAPWLPVTADAQPEVGFLQAMQRRRLSRLARMTFAVAWPLAEGRAPMPLVFASRHGETPRNLELLSDLARQAPLSPTQFSLSVHNAVIGLWSIMRNDSSEMTAIAAAGDGLEQGLLEAALLLTDGHPEVLLVVAEDDQPAVYQPWISDVPFPHALALRLTPGQDWSLHSQPATATQPCAEHWPNALQLVRALNARAQQLSTVGPRRRWHWQRQS